MDNDKTMGQGKYEGIDYTITKSTYANGSIGYNVFWHDTGTKSCAFTTESEARKNADRAAVMSKIRKYQRELKEKSAK